FGLGHQQIRESRGQRAEEARRERMRRLEDRRFISYSEFLTLARSYRNAIRSDSPAGLNAADVAALAAQADSASSAVFLLTESPVTYDACRRVLSAIGWSLAVLRDERNRDDQTLWAEVTLHIV